MSTDNPLEPLDNNAGQKPNLRKDEYVQQPYNDQPPVQNPYTQQGQQLPPIHQNPYPQNGYQQPPAYNPMQQTPYAMQIPQKSTLVAYLLWFFVPWTGAHRFYLGQMKAGIAWLIGGFVLPTIMFVVIAIIASSMPSTYTQANYPTDAYETISVVGGLATIFYFAWCFGIFVWWIVDACLLSRDVDKANQDIQTNFTNYTNRNM